MTASIPDPVLARISGLMAAHAGLVIPQRRWPALRRALVTASRALGEDSAGTLAARLLARPADPAALQALVQHAIVGETRFFRDRAVFDALRTRVLEPLVSARVGGARQLRLWSVACSTGEEAYTLAILAERAAGTHWQSWVLGSDINEASLAVARRGVYPARALREVPDWARQTCFEKAGDGRWRVTSRVRRRVGFAPLNLADDHYPSAIDGSTAMDLVMCRNALMYLEPGVAAETVQRLYRALVPGGWLVVSAVESGMPLFGGFERVATPGGILFRRPSATRSSAAPTPENASAAWPAPALAPAPCGSFSGVQEGPGPAAELPADAAVWSRRIRAHADRGELEAALTCAEAALAVRRLDPELYLLHALVSRQRGRSETALDSLRRALFLDPSLTLAEYLCARVQLDLGRAHEARRHLRNVQALLARTPPDAEVAFSDGMSAGRLAQLVADAGGSAA